MLAADPEWQERTFAAALSDLNSSDNSEKQKRDAIRILRFMDSPESIQELAKQIGHFPEGRRFDCVAGLAGSRNPSQVVQELERQMNAADVAINGEYIDVLAKLKLQVEYPPLPAYPKDNVEQQKVWQEHLQVRETELTKIEDELFNAAATLVSAKQGWARAQTVAALVLRPARGSRDIRPLTEVAAPEVVSAFLALSPEQQLTLLSSFFWERLRLPAMTRALETIVAGPNIQDQMLRDVALQRLYEVDPAEATPYILDEIKNPRVDDRVTTVKAKTLGVLLNRTLPEFDQILAGRLENKNSHTMELDPQLVGRYSTKAILPRVKAVYERASGKWDCSIEDGLVHYFLRIEPEYGLQRVVASPYTCLAESMPIAVKMKRWSEVEASVVAQLNNPDLNRARQAAETLSKFGDAKAEAALWERLRRFHQQWAARENYLRYLRGTPSDALEAIGFQYGLVDSLAKTQGWLLDEEELNKLETLALGQERENVKQQYHWKSPLEMSLDVLFDGKLRVDINGQVFPEDVSSLRAKLEQYPSGTTFRVDLLGPEERLEPVVREVRETAAARGLTIEGLD